MPRFHRGYLLAGAVLAALAFILTFWLFPEWSQSGRWLAALAVVVVGGVVSFLASVRQAFEEPSALHSQTSGAPDQGAGANSQSRNSPTGAIVPGADVPVDVQSHKMRGDAVGEGAGAMDGQAITRVDVLLVTVTDVEAQAVLDLAKQQSGHQPRPLYIGAKTYYDLATIGNTRTFMIRSEMGSSGPSGSTLTISEAINRLSPSAVIMVGIAFGIDPDAQRLGDILVSKQLLEYELQRLGTDKEGNLKITPRGSRVDASPRLLDRCRDGELSWKGPNARFGLVLSGLKLVDNLNFRDQLLQIEPEAIGGEMEGAGLYDAALRSKTEWILVKAICDWADGEKHENKSQRQQTAAQNAAGFVFHVLGRGGLVTDRQPLSPTTSVALSGQSPSVLQQPAQADIRPSATSQIPTRLYRELVGRDSFMDQVMSGLRDPSGKWIVALDGIGGIGKTALAREVADRALAERLFEAVVWEQASKEQFPPGNKGKTAGTLTYETVLDAVARELGSLDVPKLKGAEKEARVRALLQAQRVLVVLDNLETAKEPQNEIAHRLRPLLNPSKAVFTSRHRFQGDLYAIHLPGLEEEGALQLIRQEAQEKGISRVAAARADDLKQIAQTTGGSPLALKLVVGQVDHLPLDTVLKQLRDVRLPQGDSDEDDYIRFYKGIFFPSWRLLSEDGKRLLISMAHFAPNSGGTLEAIKATSDLTDEVLTHSVNELWRLSFLEISESSTLKKVRYYLHALTQYFVLSDIVQVLK